MLQQQQARQYRYAPRTPIRERPLHWCLILVPLLFIFLLIIESVAFIVLGAWHLTIPRLQAVFNLSSEIYRRELGFGILLIIIGSIGVVMSIFGLIVFFTLRLILLRIFCVCLWLVMMCGIAVGIIGIVFASQVDGFMPSSTATTDETARRFAEEKFMLGMNGALAMFMSMTLLIGIVIVRCLSIDAGTYSTGQLYVRKK